MATRWRVSRSSTSSLKVTGSNSRATAINWARVRGSTPTSMVTSISLHARERFEYQ